jgi:predicted transcriptional regulator
MNTMQNTTTITVRLPNEKIAILDQIAADEDRSRNYLLNQAVDSYIEIRQAWVNGVEEAIKQADEGKLASLDSIIEELESN